MDPQAPAPTDDKLPPPHPREWMLRGQQLEARGDPESLAEAVRSYDAAISLLRMSLPLPHYPLAIAWMNRGNAQQKLGDPTSLTAAVRSYDDAISHFEHVPPEADPAVMNSLGAAWMNRGHVFQRSRDAASLEEAIRSHQRALEWLLRLPWETHLGFRLNRSGASLNLADAYLDSNREDRAAQSIAAGRETLASVNGFEKEHPQFADIGLKARRALIMALGQSLALKGSSVKAGDDVLAEATDLVDDGLALVRSWEKRNVLAFRNIALRLYRLGAQLYRTHQPHFLAEFLLDVFEGEGGYRAERPFFEVAREAIAAGLSDLDRPRVFKERDPQSVRIVETAQSLRKANDYLNQLFPSSPQRGDASAS